MGDFRLDFENRLDLPVAQGDRAMVENIVQIRGDLRLIIFEGWGFLDRIFDLDFKIQFQLRGQPEKRQLCP